MPEEVDPRQQYENKRQQLLCVVGYGLGTGVINQDDLARMVMDRRIQEERRLRVEGRVPLIGQVGDRLRRIGFEHTLGLQQHPVDPNELFEPTVMVESGTDYPVLNLGNGDATTGILLLNRAYDQGLHSGWVDIGNRNILGMYQGWTERAKKDMFVDPVMKQILLAWMPVVIPEIYRTEQTDPRQPSELWLPYIHPLLSKGSEAPVLKFGSIAFLKGDDQRKAFVKDFRATTIQAIIEMTRHAGTWDPEMVMGKRLGSYEKFVLAQVEEKLRSPMVIPIIGGQGSGKSTICVSNSEGYGQVASVVGGTKYGILRAVKSGDGDFLEDGPVRNLLIETPALLTSQTIPDGLMDQLRANRTAQFIGNDGGEIAYPSSLFWSVLERANVPLILYTAGKEEMQGFYDRLADVEFDRFRLNGFEDKEHNPEELFDLFYKVMVACPPTMRMAICISAVTGIPIKMINNRMTGSCERDLDKGSKAEKVLRHLYDINWGSEMELALPDCLKSTFESIQDYLVDLVINQVIE